MIREVCSNWVWGQINTQRTVTRIMTVFERVFPYPHVGQRRSPSPKPQNYCVHNFQGESVVVSANETLHIRTETWKSTHSSSKVAIEKKSDIIISRGRRSFCAVLVSAISAFVAVVITVVSVSLGNLFAHELRVCSIMRYRNKCFNERCSAEIVSRAAVMNMIILLLFLWYMQRSFTFHARLSS